MRSLEVWSGRGRSKPYRVIAFYRMTSTGFGCRDLPAGSRSALVIGIIRLCDVRLADEVGVELRHLLIRSSLVDDGCHDAFRLYGAIISESFRTEWIENTPPRSLKTIAWGQGQKVDAPDATTDLRRAQAGALHHQ